MSKAIEVEFTPENYAQILKDYQRNLGEAEGREAMHQFAVNQGFSMNGTARVAGVKWVKGQVQSDGVLVQGLGVANPFQMSFFGNDGKIIHGV